MEILQTKYDDFTGSSSDREISKTEMLVESDNKYTNTSSKRFKNSELKELCIQHDIPIWIQTKKKWTGWCNVSKGMLRILYEYGFINVTLVNLLAVVGIPSEGKGRYWWYH